MHDLYTSSYYNESYWNKKTLEHVQTFSLGLHII